VAASSYYSARLSPWNEGLSTAKLGCGTQISSSHVVGIVPQPTHRPRLCKSQPLISFSDPAHKKLTAKHHDLLHACRGSLSRSHYADMTPKSPLILVCDLDLSPVCLGICNPVSVSWYHGSPSTGYTWILSSPSFVLSGNLPPCISVRSLPRLDFSQFRLLCFFDASSVRTFPLSDPTHLSIHSTSVPRLPILHILTSCITIA
jgi:hypothetical protein